MSEQERRRLEDQRALVTASLDDARAEYEAGELDDESWAAICERDTSRLVELEAALAVLPAPPAPAPVVEAPPPPSIEHEEDAPRRRGRRLWLLVVGVVLLVLAGSVLLANLLSRTTAQTTSTAAQVTALLEHADVQVSKGDVAGGLATYRAVLALDPTQPQALAETGWLTFEAGEASHSKVLVARAEAEVRAAVQAAPAYYAPRLYLGVIELLANEDPAAAMVQFRQFEALSPPARWRTTAAPYIAKATAALAAGATTTTTTSPTG